MARLYKYHLGGSGRDPLTGSNVVLTVNHFIAAVLHKHEEFL